MHMANIKGLVSISTIIACYHINGDLCGDSCKGSDISSIEFENFTKLDGDTRDKVIEAIIKNPEFNVSAKGDIEKDCIVFRSTSNTPQALYIFLFKENIYKAQTDDRIKKSIKQLGGKNIYLIVGGIIPGSPNHSKPVPFPTDEYTISKVNGNGNKYKFEITIPGVGGNPTGTRMTGGGNLSGMEGLGGISSTGGGFSPTSHQGTQS